MRIRPLDVQDAAAVREVAKRSLAASYGGVIDAATLDSAVEEWYAPAAFDDYLASDDVLFLVAEVNGELVGFSQSHVLEAAGKGRILWLHVGPEHREQGITEALFTHTRELLRQRGIGHVTAAVLAAHDPGVEFYEKQGLARLFERTVTIDGRKRTEVVYGDPGLETSSLERRETDDGAFYVAVEESGRGSAGPFYVTYQTPDRTTRAGWYCSNCDSVVTSTTDARVQCPHCGNTRKPMRWDASFLYSNN